MTEELCGYRSPYREYGPEFKCELLKGHGGQHKATSEWMTEERDICDVEHGGEHKWGKWKPFKPEQQVKGCYTTEPTKERRCKRCGEHEDDGVWGITPETGEVWFIYGREGFNK